MQAFRTILWVALAVLIVVFSFANREVVAVELGFVRFDTKVYALVIVSFLLGSLPLWLTHRLTKWQMSRRIDHTERELEIYRSAQSPLADSASTPTPTPDPLTKPESDSPAAPSPTPKAGPTE